jgi:predicted AAA+ superfamily ATPase
LGFKEFLQFRKSAKSKSSIADEFNCFLKYGGLPGIHGLSLADDTVYPYLSNLLSSILLKDVVKKHQIRDIAHLERIVAFLSDNIGNISTAKSIADYFKSQKTKITVDTVLDYLHYLEQAFFVYKAKRYDIKGKRHLELHEKYYLCDLGLRHSLLGFQNAAIAGVLENVIYLELLRRGYAVSIGATDTLEIDFVASRQSEKIYIQVSYSLVEAKTLQRELKPFLKVPDHHP